MERAKPGGDIVISVVGGVAVDFGAVAGRQYGGFGHAVDTGELLQRLRQMLGRENHALADFQRRGAVIESEGQQ